MEECGNFVVIYVNVGNSKKTRKYRNEFWVEKKKKKKKKSLLNGGDDDGECNGDDDGNAVLMSWFSGTGSNGGIQSVAGILAAATPDDDEREDAKETTTTTPLDSSASPASGGGGIPAAGKSSKKRRRAILFLRTYKGPYVCAGRLRAAGTKMDRQTGIRVDFELTDVDALVQSGCFDELVGQYLSDPEDRRLFSLHISSSSSPTCR